LIHFMAAGELTNESQSSCASSAAEPARKRGRFSLVPVSLPGQPSAVAVVRKELSAVDWARSLVPARSTHPADTAPQCEIKQAVFRVDTGLCNLELEPLARRIVDSRYDPQTNSAIIIWIKKPAALARLWPSGLMMVTCASEATGHEAIQRALYKVQRALDHVEVDGVEQYCAGAGPRVRCLNLTLKFVLARGNLCAKIRMDAVVDAAANTALTVFYEPEVSHNMQLECKKHAEATATVTPSGVVRLRAATEEAVRELWGQVRGLCREHGC